VPDVECGIRQGRAAPGIDQADSQHKRHTRFALGDVAPQRCIVDVVRALFLFTLQGTGRYGRQSTGRGDCHASGDEKAPAA